MKSELTKDSQEVSHSIIVISNLEEGFLVIIQEPETSVRQEFKIYFKDVFTRREMDFLTLEDIMSLKRLAVNMVEERILLSKADSGEYKIE